MDTPAAPSPLLTPSAKPAGRIRRKNADAILAAATEEFARHGFKGTSMNAIARRAQLPGSGCASGRRRLTKADFQVATDTLVHVLLKGCGLTPPS